MTTPASVAQRLLNIAHRGGDDYQFVLMRYGAERLLYRISQHSALKRFVLKGASLFLVWQGQSYRTTKDIDMLGFGAPDLDRIAMLFCELCETDSVEVDGLIFDPSSVVTTRIREDQQYQGVRVRMTALLGRSRIPLQVDVGFGDAVTPGPESVRYPCLLDAPMPELIAYPVVTALSEKIMAIATLGMENTRLKDYYDILVISRLWELQPDLLENAILNTCKARSLSVPRGLPIGLTSQFSQDREKNVQWNSFERRSNLQVATGGLPAVVKEIAHFLGPLFTRLADHGV